MSKGLSRHGVAGYPYPQSAETQTARSSGCADFMQFTVHKCPHCREYLKIPVSLSAVRCIHCGFPVPVPPSEPSLAPSSLGRIVRCILFGLLFAAALSLLTLARLLGLGLDCLLYLLYHRRGRLSRRRSAPLSRRRAVRSGPMLTKSPNHHMITKIVQSKET